MQGHGEDSIVEESEVQVSLLVLQHYWKVAMEEAECTRQALDCQMKNLTNLPWSNHNQNG
jgi:hypothetical protein